MLFNISTYQHDLVCEFHENEIKARGIVWNENKDLRFPIGAKVKTKFNRKTVPAIIKYYTKKKVVLQIMNSETEKRVDFSSFILDNSFTEITYRIEDSEGRGPYQSKNPTQALIEWRSQKSKQYATELMEGHALHPAPEIDSHLRDWNLGKNSYFGFDSMDQLKRWFSEEDLNLLLSQGFKIVLKQKGVDYFDSFYSSYQRVMILTEEDYLNIYNNPRSRDY